MNGDRKTSNQILAEATAAMVARFDVADALNHLIAACAAAYPAEAVAVLVSDQRGGLELLSSSSHGAAALELLQIQSQSGPCVEALSIDRAVFASGAEVVERWGEVGEAILASGFGGVHAYPMHWHGSAIGGLNIFVGEGVETDPVIGQMFADLATLAVLQSQDLTADSMISRVHDAVSARAVVEQAKGVLAYRLGADLGEAYRELVEIARRTGQSLTATAADVVSNEHSGTRQQLP